jgi:small-conductance mechanosensitive channel
MDKYLWPLLITAALALAGLGAHLIVMRLLRRLARRTRTSADDHVVNQLHAPARLMAGLLGASLGLTLLPAGDLALFLHKTAALCWIAAVAWALIALTFAAEQTMTERYSLLPESDVKWRRFMTRFKVFQRLAVAIIAVLAVGAMLLTFEKLRSLGVSLLASAGVAGVVIGFSAQKGLSMVLAGLQVAWTQPIRIDDVVIVEGEWGRIEEITLTYVVVRIWDLRRLVLPINYFLEKPFQNWTRTSANLLGAVYLKLDYHAPVDAIRAELERICNDEGAELWDGEVCNVQVTDATERTMEVRLLVSGADASKTWSLRCLVREKIIDFLRREHPETLPVTRWRETPSPATANGELAEE